MVSCAGVAAGEWGMINGGLVGSHIPGNYTHAIPNLADRRFKTANATGDEP